MCEQHDTADHTAQAWGGLTPRAWQRAALPVALTALEAGTRGVIRAATGSGKSIMQAEVLAHTIPQLGDRGRVVVSVPSQDLVRQLSATLSRRLGAELVGAYYQETKQLERPVIVTCHASMSSAEAQAWCVSCDALDPRAAQEMNNRGAMRARCHCGAAQVMRSPGGLASAMSGAGLSVEMWLADECHKTESDQIHNWHAWAAPRRALGFTATPWRANPRESLRLWDDVLFDYSPVDAMRDGAILIPEVVQWSGETRGRDAACLEMIRAHLAAHPGPGAVSASSIDGAIRFAEKLTAGGIPARAISSRNSKAERRALLNQLEAGALTALVYVNLLTEGVDLPWLQWLCLRRKRSRVAFSQEVGRVLRSHPGKPGAWVLDPFDQFGAQSLDYDAALGWSEESGADEPAEEREPRGVAEPSETGPAPLVVSAPEQLEREECLAWLRQNITRLKFTGHVEMRVRSLGWRGYDPTENQLTRVGRLMSHPKLRAAAERMSARDRAMMREVCRAARVGEITRGDVSDLLSCLFVLVAHGTLSPGVNR